jgi:hypothetical protein
MRREEAHFSSTAAVTSYREPNRKEPVAVCSHILVMGRVGGGDHEAWGNNDIRIYLRIVRGQM